MRKKVKNDFEKDKFVLMNSSDFGKIMGNVRIHKDIKLLKNGARRSYSVSEPNYYTAKRLLEKITRISNE